jgi:hypothetical protein
VRFGEVVDGAPIDEKLDKGLARATHEHKRAASQLNRN